MAILNTGQRVGGYFVQSLIKENLYTETYRVEDEDHNPYFLKTYLTNLTNYLTGEVSFIMPFSKSEDSHKSFPIIPTTRYGGL